MLRELIFHHSDIEAYGFRVQYVFVIGPNNQLNK